MKPRKKQNKHAKLLLSLFIVFIMISSIFGFLIGFGGTTPEQRIREHGINFDQFVDQGMVVYRAVIAGNEHYFFYLPSQLRHIEVDAQAAQILQEPYSLSFIAPQNNSGIIDVVRTNLAYDFNQRGQTLPLGIGEPSDDYLGMPIIACDQQTPVVMLVMDNQTKVTAQGNCITASARSDVDLLAIGESLRYYSLGINIAS